MIFGLIKRVIYQLIIHHEPKSTRPRRWNGEASRYLLNMNIEYKIIWLEHCLQLDCGKHYEDIRWQDYKD